MHDPKIKMKKLTFTGNKGTNSDRASKNILFHSIFLPVIAMEKNKIQRKVLIILAHFAKFSHTNLGFAFT